MAATTSALRTIGALVDRLRPIANKTRGMRIDAQDWNALVDVVSGLLELERAQETTLVAQLEEEFSPRHHEHTGEIGIGALDAELSARLTGAGAGVSTQLRLAEVATRLDSLGNEVARLTDIGERLQSQLDRVSTSELERTSKLRGFEGRFAGIEDLRGAVNRVTTEVGGLKPGIDAVLELRGKLADVDPAALQQRVGELEELRSSLIGADGKPLRLRDFEVSVKELQDAVGVKGDNSLDDRMIKVANELEAKLVLRVDGRLEEVTAETRKAVADGRESLEGTVATRLDDARVKLAETVGEVETRAAAERSELDGRLTRSIEATGEELRTSLPRVAAAIVDERIPALQEQAEQSARAAVEAAVPALRTELATGLRTDLDERMVAAEAVFAGRADALDAQFETRDRSLTAQVAERVADELPGLLDVRVAAAQQALGARVDGQLTQARAALSTTVNESVTATVANALQDLDGRIAAQLEPQVQQLDRRVLEVVAEGLADLDDRVASATRAEVATLDLDGRLTSLGEGLEKEFSTQIDAATTRVATDTAAQLSAQSNVLRGEIAVARDQAVTASLDRVQLVEAEQRKLSTRIDESEGRIIARSDKLITTRIQESETRLTRAPVGPATTISRIPPR
jgi:hypothetical protein